MEFYRMAVFLSFGSDYLVKLHLTITGLTSTYKLNANFVTLYLVYLFLVVDRTIIPLDKIFLMEDYLIFDVSLILEKLVINDS